MKCVFCRGTLETKLIRYVHEYKGAVIIVENVPAEVCSQCGEPLLHPDVVERIQRIVWEQPSPKRRDSVPVYDLSEVA
jgi:YgiT-type zinc finger domain-containing protein